MNRIQRNQHLERFRLNERVNVMLISIRAGGVGLNLTHANRVYIMEPYWNPAVEQQAVDRVHRLGQTLPVTTIRFIANNTIEDRMVECQKRKQKLVSLTFKSTNEEEDGSKKGKRKNRDRDDIQRERLDNLRQMLLGNEVIEIDD